MACVLDRKEGVLEVFDIEGEADEEWDEDEDENGEET